MPIRDFPNGLLGRVISDYSACNPYWHESSPWGEWSDKCSASATRTRNIECFQNETNCDVGTAGFWAELEDGTCMRKIDPENCENTDGAGRYGFDPTDAVETMPVYSSCTYRWVAGQPVNNAPSCVRSEAQTRQVSCIRELDQNPEDPAKCDPATRPSETVNVPDVSACTATRTWDAVTSPEIARQFGSPTLGGWTGPYRISSYMIIGINDYSVMPGNRVGVFDMKYTYTGSGPHNPKLGFIEIYALDTGIGYGWREISTADFDASGVFKAIEIPFVYPEAQVGRRVDFRVHPYGTSQFTVKSVGYR